MHSDKDYLQALLEDKYITNNETKKVLMKAISLTNKEGQLVSLIIPEMNIIGKLDQWYREWAGHSHLDDSNRQIFDSAEAQDFARYCVETVLSELKVTGKMSSKLEIMKLKDELEALEETVKHNRKRIKVLEKNAEIEGANR